MALDPWKLTPRDMQRARKMLAEQGEGEEPWDLLDDSDPSPALKEKRRALVAWCLTSRTNPGFTWEQAWDVPFNAFDDEGSQEVEGAEDPPAAAASGSERNGDAEPKRKRAAAASAPSS